MKTQLLLACFVLALPWQSRAIAQEEKPAAGDQPAVVEQADQDESQPEVKRPTREAFVDELARIKINTQTLKTKVDLLAEAKVKMLDALGATKAELAKFESAVTEADDAYRAAWAKVRELRMQGVEPEAVKAAIEQAKQGEAKRFEKRKNLTQNSAMLKIKIANLERHHADLQSAYDQARERWFDARNRSNDAAALLRDFEKEGRYEAYLQKQADRKAAREAKAMRVKEQATEAESLKLDRDQWGAMWEAMTPAERIDEQRRLKSEVVKTQEMMGLAQELQSALSAEVKTLTEDASSMGDEMRVAADVYRKAMDALYKKRREAADKTEVDEGIAAAKEAYESAHDDFKKKREAMLAKQSQIKEKVQEANDNIALKLAINKAVSDKFQFATKQMEADRLQEKRDAKRKAWAQAKGEEMTWQENPSGGLPAVVSGGVVKGEAKFRVTHDSPAYHAALIIDGDDRRLHVLDGNGKEVFYGPVNTFEERVFLTQDAYYLWEDLAGRVEIN